MRGPITAPTPAVSAQNYLGEFLTAVTAGITTDLIKHLLDKHKHHNDQEHDDTAGTDTNQEE